MNPRIVKIRNAAGSEPNWDLGRSGVNGTLAGFINDARQCATYLAAVPTRPDDNSKSLIALTMVSAAQRSEDYPASYAWNVVDDAGKKITLSGASKEELKKLSQFNYPA